jgi:hypothetical protein
MPRTPTPRDSDEISLLESFVQTNTSRSNRRPRSRERQIYDETLDLLEIMENDDEMVQTTLQDMEEASFFADLMATTPHYPSLYKTKLRHYWRECKKRGAAARKYTAETATAFYESPEERTRQCVETLWRNRGRWIWISLIVLYGFIKLILYDAYAPFANEYDMSSNIMKNVEVTANDSLAMRTYHEDPMDTITTIQQYTPVDHEISSKNKAHKKPPPLVEFQAERLVSPGKSETQTSPRLASPKSLGSATQKTVSDATDIPPQYVKSKYQLEQDPLLTVNTAKLAATMPSTTAEKPVLQQYSPLGVDRSRPIIQKSTSLGRAPTRTVTPTETSKAVLPKPIGSFKKVTQLEAKPGVNRIPVHVPKHNILPRHSTTMTGTSTKSLSHGITKPDMVLSLENPIQNRPTKEKYSDQAESAISVTFTKSQETSVEDSPVKEKVERNGLGEIVMPAIEEGWRPRKRGESKTPPATPDDRLHTLLRTGSANGNHGI